MKRKTKYVKEYNQLYYQYEKFKNAHPKIGVDWKNRIIMLNEKQQKRVKNNETLAYLLNHGFCFQLTLLQHKTANLSNVTFANRHIDELCKQFNCDQNELEMLLSKDGLVKIETAMIALESAAYRKGVRTAISIIQ